MTVLKFMNKQKKGLSKPTTLYNICIDVYYIKKLNKIPAATAEPITPETLGAIACINK